ncbi:hypothetical protein [Fimbriiglobus ruber]|uniref:Glycosyltransferase RgtA/B/C/D-like domain-containing protein n=1 Tax=Fimbriiglobus ruber TaxID=1908690 RepID=A0A225DTU6_9BACT|nr:hypothetical protein [Fimbriiglobus ruber]OWK40609.1 hypothetical protein FRUB_05528 [Fimbriiglobus ruber]
MDGPPARGFREQPWWLLAVVAIVAGQTGLALKLFGPTDPLVGLTDARPVVSGRHPLHLYHGTLGAASFRDRYATACYDPNFQAGYPKTPVFDGGCRPAELFLTLDGGRYDPRAYKFGLFATCVLAPLAFLLAARGAGVSAPGACLAGAGGCLVWWSEPVRAILNAGSTDHLIAGLTGLVFVGGLVRYATHPGVPAWVILAASAVTGWYAHPVLWFGLAAVVVLYYVIEAPRHGLAWHLGLIGVGVAGVTPNLWWLTDWARFWWLRHPATDDIAPLPPWEQFVGTSDTYTALLGGSPVGWVVLGLGLCGLAQMLRTGPRVTTGVVAAAALLAVVAARLGKTWSPLQIFATDRAAPFAVAVLVIPAAGVLARWWDRAKLGTLAVVVVSAGPLLLGWGGPTVVPLTTTLGLHLTPLPLGLTQDQERLVAALKDQTTPNARILIEDLVDRQAGWNWTALLPVLTDRAYIGGLDPDACVDHVFCGLRGGRMNGRAFADWTPAERVEVCRRYNIGWVVCRSSAAVAWWSTHPGAREIGRFRDVGEVVLFAIDRKPSFVLSGSATIERTDRRKLVLTDVTPNEAGEVVLSYHYQPGLQVAPSIIRATGDKDLFDPVPMIKLQLPGGISRLTLIWEAP